MELKKKRAERIDWALTLILFLFFLVSCVSIYSGQASGQYGEYQFLTATDFLVYGWGRHHWGRHVF